ncbi:MAG: hypothetical protein ABI654_03840 [Betaproteobacteria bacterium]
MKWKIFSGVVGAILLVLFIGPVVVKLKDVALTIVALIGIVMMVIDVWQTLRSEDD